MDDTPHGLGRPGPDDGDLPQAIRGLKRASVLVAGDVMLDRYVYGRVERISPEAPIPVLAIESEQTMPGGAAGHRTPPAATSTAARRSGSISSWWPVSSNPTTAGRSITFTRGR